jgi:DNA-binding response OmpR family regulator
VSADQSHPTRATETVLVVEDEVLIRMVNAEYLRHRGFKVIEAVNADEALLILQESELQVDVVFSDVEMPGSMDGFVLAKWIRANRPSTDVILAGSPSRAANTAGKLCENGPALSKPYEPQVVLDRIRRLLARRASPK